MVASQANIGGAASAVAIATARGYGDKLLPGIAVALAGYAVGNYLGFGMGTLARTMLGGVRGRLRHGARLNSPTELNYRSMPRRRLPGPAWLSH